MRPLTFVAPNREMGVGLEEKFLAATTAVEGTWWQQKEFESMAAVLVD